jgi:hypothetical protein
VGEDQEPELQPGGRAATNFLRSGQRVREQRTVGRPIREFKAAARSAFASYQAALRPSIFVTRTEISWEIQGRIFHIQYED